MGANYNYSQKFGKPVSYTITQISSPSQRSFWADTQSISAWGGSDGCFAYKNKDELGFWHGNYDRNTVLFLDWHAKGMSYADVVDVPGAFLNP